MKGVLDAGGLADCLIGFYQGKADASILDTYAKVRRDIYLNYIDKRSTKNLNRVWKTDPWTVLDTDPFFQIIKELNKDKEELKKFLLKWSSIEYDFTQHYHNERAGMNGYANGSTSKDVSETDKAADVQLEV